MDLTPEDIKALPVGALVELRMPDSIYYYLIESGDHMRPLRGYLNEYSLPFEVADPGNHAWTFGFLAIFPSRRLA